MKAKIPEAPKLLSIAIIGAVKDQLKAEKNPRLIIDMDRFHISNEAGLCRVCFAGSHLHYQLSLRLKDTLVCNKRVPREWIQVAKALDSVRMGQVNWALTDMGLKILDNQYEVVPRYPVLYTDDPKAFRAQMLRAAAKLQELGR